MVGNIDVTITNNVTNIGVGNANVTLIRKDKTAADESHLTNDSGKYSFKDKPYGEYTIKVIAAGYNPPEDKDIYLRQTSFPQSISIERIPAKLTVVPDSLGFGENASDNKRSFSLFNPNDYDLTWFINYEECPWINVVPDKGTIEPISANTQGTQLIEITIDRELFRKLAI